MSDEPDERPTATPEPGGVTFVVLPPRERETEAPPFANKVNVYPLSVETVSVDFFYISEDLSLRIWRG